jgi:hypothetical protein
MKSALLFVLIFLAGVAVIFAIAPAAARWYERYAAAAAERADHDRVQSIALAEQRAKDDEIKRIREARFQTGLSIAIMLRESMKNPASFRLERTIRTEGGVFCYWFRATNSFNAIVPGQALSYSGRLHVTGEDDFDGWWQGFCNTGSTSENFDIIPYAMNNFIKR